MEIDSNLVGTSLKEYKRDISWRQSMNYAAAVEDNNPVYLDDEREEGIVTHPLYAFSLTWQIFSNLSDFITVDFPVELMMTVIHYTEHLIIHRLMKPNDEISITGKLISILPHRAGTHLIARLEAVDKHQEPVFTEFVGGLFRGVECAGGGKQEDQVPIIPYSGRETVPSWKERISIDPLRTYVFDGCADQFNPIHTSRQFARQFGLPGIILQGTCTLAYAVKILLNREVDSNPYEIREIACQFTGMVIPGSSIEIVYNGEAKDDKGRHLYFDVYNEEKKRAIRNGYLKTSK